VKEPGKRRKNEQGASNNILEPGQLFSGTPLKSGKVYCHPQKFPKTTSLNFNDDSTQI
jgi:hypothetical protein